MSNPWLTVPGELRTKIYHYLFSSMRITLHPYYYDDTNDTDLEDDTDIDRVVTVQSSAPIIHIPEGSADGDAVAPPQVETKDLQQQWLSMLLSCKQVKDEAYDLLFPRASFTIENNASRCIDDAEFAIDKRIQHLTIEQEPDSSLWQHAIGFLRRHFSETSITMTSLTLVGDVLELDDEVDELHDLLDIVVPRVQCLSVMFEVYTLVTPQQSRFERCKVIIRDGKLIIINAGSRAVFNRVRAGLSDAYNFSTGTTFLYVQDVVLRNRAVTATDQ